MKKNILILNDEMEIFRPLYRYISTKPDYSIITSAGKTSALRVIKKMPVDLLVTGLDFSISDEFRILKKISENAPELTILIIADKNKLAPVIKKIKHVAYDIITDPFDTDSLFPKLDNALERSRLIHENATLKNDFFYLDALKNMAGESPRIKKTFNFIHTVSRTDLAVLITGEPGTGKDETARMIHNLSDRKTHRFASVDCSSMPEKVLERELFGYRKAAASTAPHTPYIYKKGLIQSADKGTIFLYEFADISKPLQKRLLRLLQKKEIVPVGDNRPAKVDVRIIAATSLKVKNKIRNGSFMEDLFTRLNVFPINLPPLRERVEDIPFLANHLLEKNCRKLNRPLLKISPEMMDVLMKGTWEGNIAEMENTIIRGILFAREREILPCDIGIMPPRTGNSKGTITSLHNLPYREAKEGALMNFNSEYIGSLLTKTGGNVAKAARICGLERQGLQQIMRRYGIQAAPFRHQAKLEKSKK